MSEWIEKQIGEIGYFKTSGVDKVIKSDEKIVRLVNYMDVYNSVRIDNRCYLSETSATQHEIDSFGLKKGDVLFTPTSETPDDIGHSSVVIEDLDNAVYSYHLTRFREFEDKLLDDEFKAYCFNQYYVLHQFEKKAAGTTRFTLTRGSFESTYLRFPSDKGFQNKIAKILSTADAVIEKTQAAIAKYKAIKQGMLQDLFTRGIDVQTGKLRPRYEDAPGLYKESKLGWIPREWNCDSIDNLTDKVGSGVTPTGGSEVYKSEGVLFLRSQNILYGKLTLNDVAFIPEEIDEIMDNSRVRPFDVLLNITGASIGRCAFFPKELGAANVNQHVCIIRFKNATKASALFTSEYFNTDFGQRQMYKAMAIGNREGLNYQQIKSFNLPKIETTEELVKISSIIDQLNNKLQTEQAYLQKMQSLKKGLMEDLLSGRKQVKVSEALVTQNEN